MCGLSMGLLEAGRAGNRRSLGSKRPQPYHFAPCVADSLRTLCCEFTKASEKHKMQTKLEKARCSCLRAALVYPININK